MSTVGDTAQEMARLQKPHRALATLFAAVWLEALGRAGRPSPGLLEATTLIVAVAVVVLVVFAVLLSSFLSPSLSLFSSSPSSVLLSLPSSSPFVIAVLISRLAPLVVVVVVLLVVSLRLLPPGDLLYMILRG